MNTSCKTTQNAKDKHIHQNKHKQKTNTNNLPHKVKAHHLKYGCEI